MKEGRCDAVKIEGGVSMAPIIRAVVDAGIPVVGHIGLTPADDHLSWAGFKVQGKGEAAGEVLADALASSGSRRFYDRTGMCSCGTFRTDQPEA